MLPVMGSAIPAVVDAVPRPGASAAEWLAASQESAGAIRVISRNQLRQDCVEALDSLLKERFAALGEAGIKRPRDALRFTNNLEYKPGAQQLVCYCMFCNTRVCSTGASRVLDHLLGCVLCPARVKEPLQALRAETTGKRKAKEEQQMFIEHAAAEELKNNKLAKALQRQQSLGQSFGAAESDLADQAIAKFFYANGLSFAAADPAAGSYYRNMVDAIKSVRPSYVPPGRQKIAGSLLESVHTRMEADIQKRDASGQLMERFGLTYTSDGWEDCNSTPLINSAYILANDGGVYLRSVDTSGMTKSGEYTANLMLEDIYEIGPTKVVCVVTDTCPTMRKAWKNVESEFPWISCCPCQTHCISLLLNDIGKVPEAARTLKDETLVVGWCRAAPYCPSPL
jgi:hypothetical protein